MSKRELDSSNGDRPPKRPRPSGPVEIAKPIEPIETARQLAQLLSFQQDDIPQLRHGIASSKAFLDEILYNPDSESHEHRLSILNQYLESEKPRDPNDTARPFLAQLWQAWSFANSNNNDQLSVSICSHFALLLKTLSHLVDFREPGRLLCRTVLQHQHLRMIKRCMDAPKHMERLLAPALRLLGELTQFDGGALAHEVYKHREQTFDAQALRKCLAIVRTDQEDPQRQPAVRTLAVHYILSHLKLQDEGGKIDILKQRSLCHTLFAYLRDDPQDVVLDILRTTESQIFKHADLPRQSKAALLGQQHLERVLDIATRADSPAAVSKAAIAWLKAVCTISSYGILRASGWYPPGTVYIDTESAFDEGAIDLGLVSLDFWENEEKYDIRNSILAGWLKTLKPNSDLRERELILSCFESAPELVHTYFKDSALQMDPKLTNTWIGYASFLFEVVNLPLPEHAGSVESAGYATLPPQTSIVLDSIFPKPLTQKIMTRCLNQSDKLISFFIVRTLVVALDKIAKLRLQYTEASKQSSQPGLWNEASTQLEAVYMQTLPPFKDVINLYRRLSNDGTTQLQREATTRLMRLYLTIFPAMTGEESIDVSAPLISALEALSAASDRPAWSTLELESLIVIARSTSEVRWFQKHGTLSTAPIIAMLKICVAGDDTRLSSLVSSILNGEGLLLTKAESDDTVFQALLHSLQDRNEHVWEFLAQCLVRVTKAPIKYLDDIDSLGKGLSGRQILLAAVLLEQSPFVIAKPIDEKKDVMKWINAVFKLWTRGDDEITANIKAKIDAIEGWDSKTGAKVKMPAETFATNVQDHDMIDAAPPTDPLAIFIPPPTETNDHPELFRWQKKDLDNALEDGEIEALMLCLCSGYAEIRRQARTQLSNLMAKLLASELEEKKQLYILVGELIETYDHNYRSTDERMPYIIGAFATHVLRIQTTPTHHMYSKINQYLMKSPEWRVSKITSYWLDACSNSMPSDDDGYWPEVQWVLEWLVDGLRTQADLELLRRAGSLERVLLIHSSPGAPERAVRQKVMELVYRAALVDPLMLATRTGILSWLSMQRGDVPSGLREHVLRHSDGEQLQRWTAVEHLK